MMLVAVGTGVGADRAAASSQDEQLFVQMVNELRTAKGLAPLATHPELTAGARSWTGHMAGSDRLAHSPDMSSGVSAKWSVLGENVGMHGAHDVGQLFQAFVDSPAHYENLVDARFNYIGVGVVITSEGKLWTTHRFMAAPAATPPTTQAPPPPTTVAPTTTAPAPTTPPSTVPTTAAPAPTTPSTAPPTTTSPAPTTAPSSNPPSEPTAEPTSVAPQAPTTSAPQTDPIPDPTIVDDPTAGPSEPDVPTVEQVLVELAEAGI